MPRLRKTLPKDFREYEPVYTVAELEQLFAKCEVDAVAGYSKATALAFWSIDVDGARWLLDHGAGVDVPDRFDKTPLVSRVEHAGSLDVVRLLLERGADPDRRGRSTSPLIRAAVRFNLDAVRLLVDAGADPAGVVGRNGREQTPLGTALTQMDDYHAPMALELARYLVPLGGTASGETPKYLRRTVSDVQRRIADGKGGEDTLATLLELLDLVRVEPPVPPRVLAEGEPITVTTVGSARYNELWKMLVPPGGPAAFVQGEVVRIIGRIGNEILNNGGGNWDRDFEAMLTAYAAHVRSGVPLDDADLQRVDAAVDDLRGGAFDEPAIDVLTDLSVAWVLRNPDRVPLPDPDYRR
ncbi:ankyrin repeat domain-containing protein [Nocardioides sp. C4-1]|uniref:ankyrin repeat domain-containing protein n=1 Tax=Nocardioides sp. C4-1 TaxID=3151851 RepID=UPI003262F2BB